MAKTRLNRHRLIATTDVGHAREDVARQFCAHRLELTQRTGRLDMVHNAAPIGQNVTLHYLRYGDEVRITPGRFDDFFLVQMPVSGHARVKVGNAWWPRTATAPRWAPPPSRST